MSCRYDKFVWSVRLSKTRSLATEAISKGKIRVNNTSIKPSKEVKIGDVIQISRHNAVFSYKVLEILDKRVGAKLVDQYIIDMTSDEEKEKYRLYQLNQSVYRSYGTGRPSKKDRRSMDSYFNDWDKSPQE